MKSWERYYFPLREPHPERLCRWRRTIGYNRADVVSGGRVSLVRYRLTTTVSAAWGRRIVFVSDQHYRDLRADRAVLDGLLSTLRAAAPHYLLLGGDVSAYACGLDEIPPMLEKLKQAVPDARAHLAVLGNWERGKHWIDAKTWEKLFAAGGFTLLVNSSWSDEVINIYGCDDFSGWGRPALPAHWEIGRVNVMLTHRPDTVIALDHPGAYSGCALAVCGHTHGGQWRLPYLGAVCDSSLYPRRLSYGCFELAGGETKMIVSSGTGQLSLPGRFFCRREAVLIEFSPPEA